MIVKWADIRIDTRRDASVYWRAHGNVTHMPTGIVIEFEEAWNDRSGRRRAVEEMRRQVELTPSGS